MNVLYPLGKGSRYKDFELRMSLRSVEKYLTGYDHIIIIGQLPGWIQGVEHIPHTDTRSYSDYNIWEKLLKACQAIKDDDFLFFNDDHYLLSPYTTDFPYYYHDSLEEYALRMRGGPYGKRADNTYNYLKEKGLPVKMFDIHCPIVYNKTEFIKILGELPFSESHGFILKSLYANSLKIEGENVSDNKLNTLPGPQAKWFSTYPHMKGTLQRFLIEQFRTKSKFEKTGI